MTDNANANLMLMLMCANASVNANASLCYAMPCCHFVMNPSEQLPTQIGHQLGDTSRCAAGCQCLGKRILSHSFGARFAADRVVHLVPGTTLTV